MSSSGDKLKKQTAKLLDHGEFLVASAKLVSRPLANPSGAPAGRPLPDKLVLAVTDRRLLVLRLGFPLERVSETTHSIPLREVVDVRSDADAKAVHFTISFRDGSTASLEAVRPNTKDGEEVARALTTALARR